MGSKRVLYISQEIYPYLPETEISLTSRYLPQAIQEEGNEVRIFMPRYGLVNSRRNQLHEVIRLSGINLVIDDTDHPLIIKVASIQSARMQVYFIDNDDFFKRKSMFKPETKTSGNDNDERSIFFVRGALETVKKLKWIPDVIHCHGLFTALAVLYLRKVYNDDPALNKAKIVYSVYNEDKPVEIKDTLFKKLAFDHIVDSDVEVMNGKTDFDALTKLAVSYSNGVIYDNMDTVSDEVKSLAESLNIPSLSYSGKDKDDKEKGRIYNDFYDSLFQ